MIVEINVEIGVHKPEKSNKNLPTWGHLDMIPLFQILLIASWHATEATNNWGAI